MKYKDYVKYWSLLCVFKGIVQHIGGERGDIQAASSERPADFSHDPWRSRQQHWTGPTQHAGEMGVCAGQSGWEEGEREH